MHASNLSFSLYGMDIDPLVVMISKIQRGAICSVDGVSVL